jgi:nucleoside-diphosphate-sugar epimerase
MNVDEVLSEQDVFVTGASGFIGTCILYKLLKLHTRKPSKQTAFILLRKSKRFPDVYARLREEVLANEIFAEFQDDLDAIIGKKIIPIAGDITKPLIGVGEGHIDMMRSSSLKCTFIHCAADIQFKGHFNHALRMNVYGTEQCIALAKEVKADGFVHVSTLYVNSREERDARVLERSYDQGFDACGVFDEWKTSKGNLSDARISEILSNKRSGRDENLEAQHREWPNTYTVTKNIAEKVAVQQCEALGIRLSVARLGIVSPIASGRHLGWFMGTGGFIFLSIGCATGHLSRICATGKGRVDLVPADWTTDALLSVCAATTSHGADLLNSNESSKFEVKNTQFFQLGIASDLSDDYSVHNLFKYCEPRFEAPGSVEDPCLNFTPNRLLFSIYEFFVFDLWLYLAMPFEWMMLKLQGLNALPRSLTKWLKKIGFLRRARAKMVVFNENYLYFLEQRWRFDTTNISNLYDSLDDRSRKAWSFAQMSDTQFYEYCLQVSERAMTRWHEYKLAKRKSAAKDFVDKHAAHTVTKKDTSWQFIWSVLRQLGVSFGGISSRGVAYPFAVSITISFVLLGLIFFVIP